MMMCMKLRRNFRRVAMFVWLACLLVPAAAARADDDELPNYDARTAGYPPEFKTHMDNGSTLGAWALFVPLAGITLGVMCKNANRSHLD